MPQNDIPQYAVDITKRYFQAVQKLHDDGKIRGLGTLAKKWDASRYVLSTTRSYPEKKRLNTEFIYYLSRDYNVSLEWLFHGTGSIFK